MKEISFLFFGGGGGGGVDLSLVVVSGEPPNEACLYQSAMVLGSSSLSVLQYMKIKKKVS